MKTAGPYTSEFEQFFNGYLRQHPELEELRLRGWYLLWDRPVDFDALERERQSTVPAKAYQYE